MWYIDIEKRKFHYSKYPIDLNNDIDKILICDNISSGKKRF